MGRECCESERMGHHFRRLEKHERSHTLRKEDEQAPARNTFYYKTKIEGLPVIYVNARSVESVPCVVERWKSIERAQDVEMWLRI